MNYVFEKIGNLEKANISIEKEKVNVKYGFNGIGKTTLVKSIKYIFGTQEEKNVLNRLLISQKTGAQYILPESIMKSDFNSLMVYDRQYFDKLFKQTDLLNNTFELLIDSQDYSNLREPIVKNIEKLKDAINNTNYIDLFNLINTLGDKELIKYKQDGKSVIKSSTFLYNYSTKNVSISEDVPQELDNYKQFIKSSFRSDWNKWILNAKKDWYEDNRCPFCGNLFDGNLKNNIDSLIALKNKSEYAQYDKEQSFVSVSANFIDGELSANIKAINDLRTTVNLSTISPLQEGIDFLKKENEKIKTLFTLDAMSLVKAQKDRTYQDLKNILIANKLGNNLLLKGRSDGNDKTGEINSIIDLIISDLDTLQDCIGDLNSKISGLVAKNEKIINEFLEIAGMPYSVEIKQQGDTLFETLFSYKGSPNIIDNQSAYLSFGEANALSLLLFCLEARNKDNVLVILDDPVSSFDNNKRYAIYDYLFNNNSGRHLLWKKTTLIFTHDFETVIAFSNCYPLNRQNIANYAYMCLSNNELQERIFTQDDITNTLSLYKSVATDVNKPKISRVVAARHCSEICLNKGSDEYCLLSSLVHKRSVPTKDEEGTIQFSPSEITLAENNAKDLIGPDFSYSTFYAEITNDIQMKAMYASSNSKFDKLVILRCLLQNARNSSVQESVLWNFLSEVYHVEKDTIYSIGSYEVFDIPDYIISLCDAVISQI